MINHLKENCYILCKINLAIVLYWSVHPYRLLYFIFSMMIIALSPDKDIHVKDCRIFKLSACNNVTLDFEASVQNGHGSQNFLKPLLSH